MCTMCDLFKVEHRSHLIKCKSYKCDSSSKRFHTNRRKKCFLSGMDVHCQIVRSRSSSWESLWQNEICFVCFGIPFVHLFIMWIETNKIYTLCTQRRGGVRTEQDDIVVIFLHLFIAIPCAVAYSYSMRQLRHNYNSKLETCRC